MGREEGTKMYRWQFLFLFLVFFFLFLVYAVSGPGPAWANNQWFQYFYKNLAIYYKPRFNLQDRKNIYKQAFDSIAESLSSDGFGRLVTWFILWTTWQNLSIDCGELVTSVSVQCWSRKKYFDGLPNASLEHALLPREDRRGGHIQEGPDNFGWSPTVVVDAVVMTTCSLKLTPKGLSCLQ